ncbi:glycosyl hydrolase [bacterium]|nr:glycosyl hydrolase [bacterium]
MSRVARFTLILASLVIIAGSLVTIEPDRRHPADLRADGDGPRWSQRPGDGLPPRAPNPYFFVERAWPQMEIPREAWHEAQLQARALRDQQRGERAVWYQRGPTNIGGRITSLAVDPRDQDVVYAGAAEGGVMVTRDGGQSWQFPFDGMPSLAIGAVALDPVDPDIVYAGTGEVNPGGGSVAYGGTGLYRSRDRGETWEGIGLENVGAIGRIVIDPSDPDRILVAAMGFLWSAGPERGIYRSEDGGETWEQVLYVDDTTGCVDLILRPDQPQTVLAAMWQRLRTPERYDYGGPGCAVWRTDDGGDTWTPVGGGLPTPGDDSGRIGLALCQNQSTRMYAVYADRTGYFDGLWRSDDAGASWTRTNDWALSNVFASYGWWFGNVRCHPDEPNTVFVLGLDFYRSLNGGSSWSEVSGGMHVDHHAMQWGPLPDRVIYEGNDGGVYRSTNGGSVWTLLPDQPITQVYRLGLDATNPDRLYLGGQDISTVRTLTGALDDWETIFGGDGFQPLIHPEDPDRIWAQYQYGQVFYSSNGGYSFTWATGGISGSDRTGWNAPHVQDPTDPDTRYFGTSKVYRNVGNTSWTAISGDLTGGPHQNQNGQVNGTLTTLSVSPLDAEVIWSGSDDGRVHVTTSGGAFWSDVSGALPERWVTSVHADPLDRETAYVTISGFRWHEPLPHVFRTTDLGETWQAIAGNLPEAPANDVIAHPTVPGRLYVATDLGVYTTDDAATWQPLGTGLPNVVVTDLAYSEARAELVAGTYGRSIWSVPVDDVTATPGVRVADLGQLRPPFPNPTSGGTTVAWDLRRGGAVAVEVYTVSGRRVWRTERGGVAAGPGSLFWDGRDQRGRPAAAGVYLARVLVDGEVLGRRTVVLTR